MHKGNKIAILLLAAGASRRLGRPKQLLELGGKSLLRRMVELAISLNVGPVAVVIGAQAARMRQALDGLELQIVENPDFLQGMSTSLRAGIQLLESLETKPKAILVLLVDQPRVNASLLQQILSTYLEQKPLLVASFYNQMHGVPALFDQSLFNELKSIEGDKGARQVIRQYEGELVSIPFPGGKEDIDTEEDFNKMKKCLSARTERGREGINNE